jgi:hypothetical protein
MAPRNDLASMVQSYACQAYWSLDTHTRVFLVDTDALLLEVW